MSAKSTYLKNKSMFEKLKGTSGKIVPVKVVNQKKKTRRTNLTMINRTPFLPIKKWATLPYHETFKIATGANVETAGTMIWSLNGMYDPEFGIGGHQPMGFDQLMNQYFNFTVLKSIIEVEAVRQIDYKNVVTFIAYHNEHGVPAAAYAAGGANGLREMSIISKDLMPNTIGHYDQSPRTTKLSVDIAKVNGKTPMAILADPNYSGSDAADPVEDCYFSVNTYAPDASDQSAATLNLKVTITYLAMFHEPRWLTLS